MDRRKVLLSVGFGAFAVQGLVMGTLALTEDKLYTQGMYLASIIERNADRLDEFDLIALRELGILKEK